MYPKELFLRQDHRCFGEGTPIQALPAAVTVRLVFLFESSPTLGADWETSHAVKDLLIKVKWKFQNIEFEKKGIRNQAAEQFKIERAAGQGGIWYRFRPVSVCLDKQLPRRNKYAGTC